MSTVSDQFVLIIGAGPVGLTMAHELSRRGVSVRLVDAAPGPAVTSRAVGTHARTLEIYDQMGVLEQIQQRGQRVHAFTRHRPGREPMRYDFDFGDLPSPFEYAVFVDQVITEQVLRDAVTALGTDVEWGVRLEEVTQDDEQVRAILRAPDGETTVVSPQWLIGCDGGHSTVRKALRIPLEGTPSQTWLIADAVVDADFDHDAVHWMPAEGGSVMLFPFPNDRKWRLLDTGDPHFDGDSRQIADRFARKIGSGIASTVAVADPTWVSVFTIQQRAVSTMRVGRCFVAGDAAHVHSPASGQGMNTGIQDAFNLAWKLAEAIDGGQDGPLLDSYSAERVPVGQSLLRSTADVTTYIESDDIRSDDQSDFLDFGKGLIGGMSALGIAYPDSPLTRPTTASSPGPQPGERITQCRAQTVANSPAWQQLLAALRRPGWILLAATGAHTASASPNITGYTIVDTPSGAPHELVDRSATLRSTLSLGPDSWLLIRPDGYLAARGTPDDRLPTRPPLFHC